MMMDDYKSDLSIEELRVLIKSCKDNDEKTRLQHELKSKLISYDKNNFISLCESIINHIGYTQNTLYKEEISIIMRLYNKEIRNLYYNEYNTEETIGISLVTEILDYYNASYNEVNLLFFYNVDKYQYKMTKKMFNEILYKYYWHK